jgi:membrane protease YdiL (CAAX protease family)
MLLGYIFYWSKNIWYPIVTHITNNLIAVLGVYFLGPQIMDPDSESSTTILLIIPSIVLSVLIIFKLKRNLTVTEITK